jgi:hypothetical protein
MLTNVSKQKRKDLADKRKAIYKYIASTKQIGIGIAGRVVACYHHDDKIVSNGQE